MIVAPLDAVEEVSETDGMRECALEERGVDGEEGLEAGLRESGHHVHGV